MADRHTRSKKSGDLFRRRAIEKDDPTEISTHWMNAEQQEKFRRWLAGEWHKRSFPPTDLDADELLKNPKAEWLKYVTVTEVHGRRQAAVAIINKAEIIDWFVENEVEPADGCEFLKYAYHDLRWFHANMGNIRYRDGTSAVESNREIYVISSEFGHPQTGERATRRLAQTETSTNKAGRPLGSKSVKLSKDEEDCIRFRNDGKMPQEIDGIIMGRHEPTRGRGSPWEYGTAELVLKASRARGVLRQTR